MVNQGIYKDNKMTGPLGQYAIAGSLVKTPGWKPLEAEENEMLPKEGGGGSFSMGFGGGQYRGRIGADTSNLPPSQRGLYENSAPSKEAIESAYNANLKNGMTHQEIMKLFNDQADRDANFWSDGFAKDPNFDKTLLAKSQAMMGTDANQASIAAHQKNIPALAASRNAWDHSKPPKANSWGPWAGNATKSFTPKVTKVAAPLNPRTGKTFSAINPRW